MFSRTRSHGLFSPLTSVPGALSRLAKIDTAKKQHQLLARPASLNHRHRQAYAWKRQRASLLSFAIAAATYAAGNLPLLRELLCSVISKHLGQPTASADLPTSGRLTLFRQAEEDRYVLHLLYAPTILRGSDLDIGGGTTDGRGRVTEIIEDFVPLRNVVVDTTLPVERAVLQPQGTELPIQDGKIFIPEFEGHQIVELR